MEKFTKKIIYGGSSKIILEGQEMDQISGIGNFSIHHEEQLPFVSDDHFGEYLVENWNLFAYRSKSIIVEQENASRAFEELKDKLNNERAAGGVLKKGHEYLMIKRNGFWEFPKGKLEKKEDWKNAAVREVEEETGVDGWITGKIHTTYHVYKRADNINLKETRWFSMEAEGEHTLTPQEKEGITEVGFFDRETVEKLLTGSYDNMILTWEHYKHHNL